jgi:uncharacterized damage-inducible protein DinB
MEPPIPPPDPLLQAARRLVRDSLEDLASSIHEMPTQALNWRPAEGTNSIAGTVTHALGASRLWLYLAMGLPLPERDRDAEFTATASDAGEFADFVQGMANDCLDALDSADHVDWGAMRLTLGRGGDAPPEETAGFALIHATEHLRGHVDEVSLARRIWEQQR